VTTRSQAHQALMVSHLTPYNPAFQAHLQALAQTLGSERQALGVVYRELLSQAGLWAYINNFRLLTLLCVLCALAAFLFKCVRRSGPVAAH
jgi:MFS transporter, DHA2 family, multidrug resistance protein